MKKALAEPSAPVDSPLDRRELAEVERAFAELRSGRPVRFVPLSGPSFLVFASDTLDSAALAAATAQGKGRSDVGARLIVTATRARHLGLAATKGEATALCARNLGLGDIAQLADPTRQRQRAVDQVPPVVEAPFCAGSILDLLKSARLLPAALVSPAESAEGEALVVTEAAVRRFRDQAARTLSRVAEANVPLLGAEQTRIVAFRPADGGREHLAIIVGEPKPDAPLLARLHSECFTGDLLRSLRCDCGDQLRGAIDLMSQEGGGVLLYLAQEGRGIGLVNKLRAYALQDHGADTLDANEQLGFDADERVYKPAAEMLRQLGIKQIRLLTNNPLKVEALMACGVDVVARVPHSFPANCHNAAYLHTKSERFGHFL
ncbi:MAG TPA: GTP cyclohydrolase II [Kiloniellales bacterium]|jgi:GTP cyclohydrolase II|nr:GTP cyclohydrolase II [Kiloniellales bacterium]